MILRKFPGVCPYCRLQTCTCWKTGKPPLDEKALRKIYYSNASGQKRTVDDFQLMFRRIYEESWTAAEPESLLRMIHTRLIEELAEVAEAIRFHHLYPSNFNNEIADCLVVCPNFNNSSIAKRQVHAFGQRVIVERLSGVL